MEYLLCSEERGLVVEPVFTGSGVHDGLGLTFEDKREAQETRYLADLRLLPPTGSASDPDPPLDQLVGPREAAAWLFEQDPGVDVRERGRRL